MRHYSLMGNLGQEQVSVVNDLLSMKVLGQANNFMNKFERVHASVLLLRLVS